MQRSTVALQDVDVLVTQTGEGQPLLCLHGWGASHESFTELRLALIDIPVKVIAPDLPGFGMSSEPSKPWSVDDYADCIEQLVAHFQLTNVLLLGHSFGGRIAIKLAARKREWISHLYLCAAAGIKRPQHIRRALGITLAECGKAIFSFPGLRSCRAGARKILYKIMGVHDYERASDLMRETMMTIINEDLTPVLERIAVPTDLFWGEEDRLTPLSDGKLMNKKIVQSTLHAFPGVRHSVHRVQAQEIAQAVQCA